MRMSLSETLEVIQNLRNGETLEEYQKRMARIRKYSNERDFLIDAIAILDKPEDSERRKKKEARLNKVLNIIETLR